jgi:hypothetical protein
MQHTTYYRGHTLLGYRRCSHYLRHYAEAIFTDFLYFTGTLIRRIDDRFRFYCILHCYWCFLRLLGHCAAEFISPIFDRHLLIFFALQCSIPLKYDNALLYTDSLIQFERWVFRTTQINDFQLDSDISTLISRRAISVSRAHFRAFDAAQLRTASWRLCHDDFRHATRLSSRTLK